jgi:hypothetical protein
MCEAAYYNNDIFYEKCGFIIGEDGNFIIKETEDEKKKIIPENKDENEVRSWVEIIFEIINSESERKQRICEYWKKQSQYLSRQIYNLLNLGKKKPRGTFLFTDTHGDLSELLFVMIASGAFRFKEGEPAFKYIDIETKKTFASKEDFEKSKDFPEYGIKVTLFNEKEFVIIDKDSIFACCLVLIPNIEPDPNFQCELISNGDVVDRGHENEESFYNWLNSISQFQQFNERKSLSYNSGNHETSSLDESTILNDDNNNIFAHLLSKIKTENSNCPDEIKYILENISCLRMNYISKHLNELKNNRVLKLASLTKGGIILSHTFWTKQDMIKVREALHNKQDLSESEQDAIPLLERITKEGIVKNEKYTIKELEALIDVMNDLYKKQEKFEGSGIFHSYHSDSPSYLAGTLWNRFINEIGLAGVKMFNEIPEDQVLPFVFIVGHESNYSVRVIQNVVLMDVGTSSGVNKIPKDSTNFRIFPALFFLDEDEEILTYIHLDQPFSRNLIHDDFIKKNIRKEGNLKYFGFLTQNDIKTGIGLNNTVCIEKIVIPQNKNLVRDLSEESQYEREEFEDEFGELQEKLNNNSIILTFTSEEEMGKKEEEEKTVEKNKKFTKQRKFLVQDLEDPLPSIPEETKEEIEEDSEDGDEDFYRKLPDPVITPLEEVKAC